MDPITLAALLGGASFLQESTTGRQKQQDDAKLKATAYRLSPYLKSINPEGFSVHQADPFGGLLQGGLSGYSLGSGIEKDNAWRNFLNTKSGLPPNAVVPQVELAQPEMGDASGYSRKPSPWRLMSGSGQ